MTNNKETSAERLARMQREREAAKAKEAAERGKLVGQLTHEDDGDQDFSELAKKLEERKAQEAKGENDGFVKMTIYIRQDIAAGFNALCTKRGLQKEYANQAIADFVAKKARELGIGK